MKRPFREVSEARLNRAAPLPRAQDCQASRAAPRRWRNGLVQRSLDRATLTTASFPQLCRLDSLSLYSAPSDIRTVCEEAGVPFALSNANTCSLSAIGYESGLVRVFDHAPTALLGEQDILSLYPHRNAIFDVQWSVDDKQLLTAGGDQAACLMDVQTQKVLSVLVDGHKSTIKDVKFDPRNPSICVTGAREGTVSIWDLRSKADSRQGISWCALDGSQDMFDVEACGRISTLSKSHDPPQTSPKRQTKTAPSCSITAMIYKGDGTLVTACSANAFLKTWDLRYIRNESAGSYPLLNNRVARPSRQTAEAKLSVGMTGLLENHGRRARDYGVASLALSHDDQRIYSTNRDNRIYEYTTSHPDSAPTKVFEVPDLRVNTFYCKSSLSKDNYLVCGNYSGHPVVIDTEQQPGKCTPSLVRSPSVENQENWNSAETLQSTKRIAVTKNASTITRNPISGRVCRGGHDLEATCVAWSHDSSSLVTAGDDKCIRTWRRDERLSGKEVAARASDGDKWAYL